ncbi:tRNA pseudouridine synthase [Geopyxis carbonaria]|nr:tRNA pseudouridine synthase [Geopyxis carbonaria]
MSEHNETPTTAAPFAEVSPTTGDTTASIKSEKNGKRNHQRGGRSSRARGRDKRADLGRQAYKRKKDDDWSNDAKRLKPETTEGENGEKEERKPKRKVAVMMSYCGSGYRGMQLNPPHKSIEGDMFEAFVKAGAISRSNSDDPKKSSLNRCARTDKGVHAAGNVISLKLIIEEPDIVAKINSYLPEQIRIWDIIRTTGSFTAYQICDSRKYEYLLPSHVFLPPHPKTYLAKELKKSCEEEGDIAGYESRQKCVLGWWDEVEKKVSAMLANEDKAAIDQALEKDGELENPNRMSKDAEGRVPVEAPSDPSQAELLKKIRAIHIDEKRQYRISPERLERVREGFKKLVGTLNFHNYTVDKSFKDPSAKRHIKSFEVGDPMIINGTEWLSIRVHGQSFMMHQIRKMVGMVMMVVRTGCPLERIDETLGQRKVSIGKAPGLGLHLEYPLFGHYNEKTAVENGRDPLDFSKYKEQVDEFKQKYIYTKIYDEEGQSNTFTNFVQFLDTYKCPTYLYLTSGGFKTMEAAQAALGDAIKAEAEKDAPEDEDDGDNEGGEG